jgi:hypothetical protein
MANTICPKCSDRERHVSATGRIQPYCRPCGRQYTRDRNKNQRVERKAWIDEYKTAKGCCKCGYNVHPVALELNHIDPSTKEFTVSRCLGSGYTWDKVLAEIEKCDVMCSNCHQIHTYENKHSMPKSLRSGED